MANLLFETTGVVQGVPEQKSISDEYGMETPRWTVNLLATPGDQWGDLLEVADPKLAEVLRANVGKKVRVTVRPLALKGGKRGAWLKLACSSVVPVS